MNQATIIRLMDIARGLSYYTLKKYLFYMIDYDFISYQGENRVYVIKDEGWKLLSMIKRTRNMVNVDTDTQDIIIAFE